MTAIDPEQLDGDDLDIPTRSAGSRRWWVIGSIGVAAMTAVVVWFAWSATAGRVSWQTRSYEVVDASNVTVSFDVHRPAGMAVTCRLKALNQRFATVGSVDVLIPAGEQRSLTQEGNIRTTSVAVTGTVERCKPA